MQSIVRYLIYLLHIAHIKLFYLFIKYSSVGLIIVVAFSVEMLLLLVAGIEAQVYFLVRRKKVSEKKMLRNEIL